MFPVITQALAQGKRVCVASPRADVVKEFKLRVEPVFKKISIAALYAGRKEIHENAQFIISTTHQSLRFKRAFDLLIIDTVDALPHSPSTRLNNFTVRSCKQEATTLYLTATPSESLKKPRSVFFPTSFHQPPLIIPRLIYSYQLTKKLKESQLPPE